MWKFKKNVSKRKKGREGKKIKKMENTEILKSTAWIPDGDVLSVAEVVDITLI